MGKKKGVKMGNGVKKRSKCEKRSRNGRKKRSKCWKKRGQLLEKEVKNG